jgi:hypothetical protein
MNAIPDKFAQWDVAYVLRRAVSCRAPGVRGASGQLSHLPVGRLGTYCPSRVCWLRARQRMRRCCLGGRRGEYRVVLLPNASSTPDSSAAGTGGPGKRSAGCRNDAPW